MYIVYTVTTTLSMIIALHHSARMCSTIAACAIVIAFALLEHTAMNGIKEINKLFIVIVMPIKDVLGKSCDRRYSWRKHKKTWFLNIVVGVSSHMMFAVRCRLSDVTFGSVPDLYGVRVSTTHPSRFFCCGNFVQKTSSLILIWFSSQIGELNNIPLICRDRTT